MIETHTGSWGYGRCNHVFGVNGLPAEKPAWFRDDDYIRFGQSFVEFDGRVYFKSLKLDQSAFEIAEVNLESGEFVVLAESNTCSDTWARDFRVASLGLISDHHYIRLNGDKSEVIDLSPKILALEKPYSGVDFQCGTTVISKYLYSEGQQHTHFIFDTLTREQTIVDLPIRAAKQEMDSDLLYGITTIEGKHYVSCCDRYGKVQWRTPTRALMAININQHIFQYFNGWLTAFDKSTGALLCDTRLPDLFAFERVSFANDTIAIVQDKVLHVYSWQGELLYKLEGQNIRAITGAGDLLFCTRARVTFNGSEPLPDDGFDRGFHSQPWLISAYDRYTGEKLWEVDKSYRKWDELYIVGGHLVAEQGMGHMACWKLGEPYISPHRPS